MRVDSQRAVINLTQLSFWQRLKGAWFLLLRGRFQIDGTIHNDFEASIRDLEADVLHWKRVAMQEAGFGDDVIAAICAPPVPLTPEELATAQKFAADWFAKRKQL